MSRFLLPLFVLGCPKAPAPDPQPVATRMVHIAALNDFHGALYESPKRGDASKAYGGLPWLVAAMDTLRAEHPDLLILDGGDIFQGSWPVNATQGRGAVEAYNLLGVHAAAVGNHEFDYGGIEGGHPLRGALEHAGTLAEYDWLAANIRDANGPWAPEGFAPWVMVERGGVKIGVIGLSTQDTPTTTLAKNVADLTFDDVVETVRKTVPTMKAEGAELIVAVGHLTGQCKPKSWSEASEHCEPGGEVGRLLNELEPGMLDVLITGHAHTLMHHRVRDTFVLEQRAYGHAIGRLDLVVGPDGLDADASRIREAWFLEHDAVDPGCEDTPFPLDAIPVGGRSLSPHPEALALIEKLEAEAGSLCDEVGCSDTVLTRDRGSQSAVGDFVADAMRAAFPSADLAVTNSGGLRADLPKGVLRREHLQAVMPFDNRLLLLEMTGTQVEEMLRVGSSGGHGVLQLSGGTYAFDPEASTERDVDGDGQSEPWETDRLCANAITIGGAALEPAGTYEVITTDFLYDGGDHLGPAFKGVPVLEQGPLLRDAMNTYTASLDVCLTPSELVRIRTEPCDN